MTRKVYKSAMGKTVDLGALLLQNEQVRAVGNMGVNAAGDLIDSTNRVIDQRTRQVQRQYKRQTNVSAQPVYTSKAQAKQQNTPPAPVQIDSLDMEAPMPTAAQQVQETETTPAPAAGGLAAAIARSREIKQELEKKPSQLNKEQGLKKI